LRLLEFLEDATLPPLFIEYLQNFVSHSTSSDPFVPETSTPDLLQSASSFGGGGDGFSDVDSPSLSISRSPTQVLRKLPCDKPQCNFEALSCALPDPWRPPKTNSKDFVSCEKAWAKLASHDGFVDCDVDELCMELRAKAKCSPEGKPVVEKVDLIKIFESIPERRRKKVQGGL